MATVQPKGKRHRGLDSVRLAPIQYGVMNSTQTAFYDLGLLIGRLLGRWAAFANRPRQFGSGWRIYPSELYAVEAIGRTPGINVTRLAATLGVTKGAVSQTAGKLVRKGLVRKVGGTQSAREVCLVLTRRGRAAFLGSEKFYQLAYRLFLGRYGKSSSKRIRQFRETFTEFSAFFEEFIRQCPADFPAPRKRQRSSAAVTV
jgi:DNA-binding MarR family transcriptional regulator